MHELVQHKDNPMELFQQPNLHYHKLLDVMPHCLSIGVSGDWGAGRSGWVAAALPLDPSLDGISGAPCWPLTRWDLTRAERERQCQHSHPSVRLFAVFTLGWGLPPDGFGRTHSHFLPHRITLEEVAPLSSCCTWHTRPELSLSIPLCLRP